VLTKNEIQSAGIVHHSVALGARPSTYDATVGTIIYDGKIFTSATFILEPRGVVWVISTEEIETKGNHTALATLKTSWAHQGVFALNVGVVDPGWHGPIATALVNFSNEPFKLKKGMPFLRLVLFQHTDTGGITNRQDMDTYIAEIRKKSKGFSKSFLNMHTLVKEVESEVFKLPKWAFYGVWGALLVAVASIFAPIAYTVFSSNQDQQVKLAQLLQRVDDLESKSKEDEANVKLARSLLSSLGKPFDSFTAKSAKEKDKSGNKQ
jgi:deoxycytidine triphosphate deaminase